MYVTRAVLPVMRKQRSGHIISISSTARLVGFEFGAAYAVSKFGLEGRMASLRPEEAPFGMSTTIVNPGFFRTELLTEQSTNFATPSIADYDERRTKQLEFWKGQDGRQSATRPSSRERFLPSRARTRRRADLSPGPTPLPLVEQVAAELRAQAGTYRDLSTSLAFDEPAGRAM